MELDCLQLLVVVPALLTFIWAVVSFTMERQTKQKQEQQQLFALYVGPFMMACQELQSRLCNMLVDADRGTAWNKESKDSSLAEETLYLIAQYFGWERRIFRYGPYARDTEVFQRTEAIRAAFATNRVGVPEGTRGGSAPFCFYRNQQKALAQIVLERGEGPAGLEAETVTYFDFERLSELNALPSVLATRELLASVEFPKSLDDAVRGRLVEVQNHLVMLLAYLERKEGFTLAFGKRDAIVRDPVWIEWAKDRGWDTLLPQEDQTTP